MLKRVVFLALLLQVVSAMAQKAVVVHLPSSGAYAIFTSKGLPTEPPPTPQTSKGGDATVAASAGDDTVSVWDKGTGNMGSKPLSKVADGWKVAPEDLDHIAQVDIHVVHDGSPVAAAQVQLADGITRQPEIVEPKSAGVASFFNVKPGRLLTTVRVKGEGGGTQDITQIFQGTLNQRQEVKPSFTVAVAQAVDTASTASAAVPKSDPTKIAPSTEAANTAPSIIGSIFTYLIALAIAGGVIFGAIHYFKHNAGTVSEKLEQLGVQIPKPDDQGALGGSTVPIALPKPEPPQKIMLDDAAPTPLAAPISAPVMPMYSEEPSLLTAEGITLPLIEGETVVGRDPGLGLSLTGETTVSRRHATIQRQGSEVMVTDLGSTNGTFINGSKLQGASKLSPGDSVQFGSVAFRYQG